MQQQYFIFLPYQVLKWIVHEEVYGQRLLPAFQNDCFIQTDEKKKAQQPCLNQEMAQKYHQFSCTTGSPDVYKTQTASADFSHCVN